MWVDRYGPAVAGWAIIATFVAAYDYWLIRRGHEPLSAVARTPGGRVVRGYVSAHFDEWLGPLDLFSRIGRRI